jgi:hypothetical protein
MTGETCGRAKQKDEGMAAHRRHAEKRVQRAGRRSREERCPFVMMAAL